jgi:hypothetical protein
MAVYRFFEIGDDQSHQSPSIMDCKDDETAIYKGSELRGGPALRSGMVHASSFVYPLPARCPTGKGSRRPPACRGVDAGPAPHHCEMNPTASIADGRPQKCDVD